MKVCSKFIVILICLSQLFCENSTATFPSIREVSVIEIDGLWVITNTNELFRITSSGKEKVEITPNIKIRKVFFINDNEGWVLDSVGRIWFTQDRGKSWDIRGNVDSDNNNLQSELIFVDKQVGWLTIGLSILLTEDGGSSWKKVYPTNELSYSTLSSAPTKIFPVNSNLLWVGMSNGKILKTINRGQNWENFSTNTNFDIKTLFAIDEKKVWIGCWSGGGVFYSGDGGKTWLQMLDEDTRENVGVSSITFPTEDIGWIVGRSFVTDVDNPNNLNGVTLKTTNQGKTWLQLEGEFYKQPFNKIIFFDVNNGLIINDNSIHRTSNGGKNWQMVFRTES